MIKYEEENKKDPAILNYSLKGGVEIIILIAFCVFLYTSSIHIMNGYESFINISKQFLIHGIEFLEEIKQIVNETATLCIMWFSMAIVIWSLFIMLKVKQDCQKSKRFWKSLTLIFLFISKILIFFSLYILSSEESSFLIRAILTGWIFITAATVLSFLTDDSTYMQYKLED